MGHMSIPRMTRAEREQESGNFESVTLWVLSKERKKLQMLGNQKSHYDMYIKESGGFKI